MILERVTDLVEIKSFMLKPEICNRASEDGECDTNFTQGPREVWLFAIEGGEAVGIIHTHLENGAAAWFHPYILRSHKDNYLDLVNAFLIKFKAEFPKEIQKLNAYIPTYATKAYEVALSAGFKDEGLNRMSFMKFGKLWDRHLMGVIRGEINV